MNVRDSHSEATVCSACQTEKDHWHKRAKRRRTTVQSTVPSAKKSDVTCPSCTDDDGSNACASDDEGETQSEATLCREKRTLAQLRRTVKREPARQREPQVRETRNCITQTGKRCSPQERVAEMSAMSEILRFARHDSARSNELDSS